LHRPAAALAVHHCADHFESARTAGIAAPPSSLIVGAIDDIANVQRLLGWLSATLSAFLLGRP
jgi:hypothetical protein